MRILGLNHNKVLIVTDGAANAKAGMVDQRTANQLVECGGFVPYEGPAKTTTGGWIVPGSDPELHPHSPTPRDARNN